MIFMGPDAPCADCKHQPKIVQPDGTESSEKWVCLKYRKLIPDEIMRGSKCEFYKPID